MAATDLILLSGGLDSIVLAYKLVADGRKCRALLLNYGMKPSLMELHSAKKAAFDLELPLEIVDAKGISLMQFGLLPYRSIVADEQDMSPGPYPDIDFIHAPSGFSMPLSIASFYALISGLSTVHVGVIKEQTEYRPKLKDFLKRWSETNALLNPKLPEVEVSAPFIDMPKWKVVLLGKQLGVRFENTWSCYVEEVVHCGICPSCVERREAFKKAKQKDPTMYQKKKY
jgi:7-cyano-7-deazaguanine synthase